jgi:Fe-S oxidoreductase
MDFPPQSLIAQLRAEDLSPLYESDSVWLCMSCQSCTSVCPKQIPVTDGLMTTIKAEMMLRGKVPAELQSALENAFRYGNALGASPRKRADWTKGLDVPVMGSLRQPVEVLWYVGDYGSFHPRLQEVSRALAKLLQALGVSFGILGPEEVSDGDSQRLAGEPGLFETLARKNAQALSKYQFQRIVTTDPHAYNALKNEYPALGITYPVQHLAQFLAERLEQLKPLLKQEVRARVAYHDPCYLGRANGIFEEPRALLAAIPGIELVEMPHERTTSLCCGGGGGGMWLDGFTWERAHARTSEWRVREAVGVGADVLAVACPYEPPRFEDAAKSIGEANNLAVKDIVELLVASASS